MLIAGEASGDGLAAELVAALRQRVLAAEARPTHDLQPLRTELTPHFFGAGGPRMKAAGVELALDLTQHSLIGISEVFRKYLQFRKLFRQLFQLALDRQPDAIIGVDYGGFNLRFGHAIRRHVRRHRKEFVPWNPRLVQYVSPQVWASRPGRAFQMAEDYDLVLSLFPFEKEWYARRVPNLRVEFVGHPIVERLGDNRNPSQTAKAAPSDPAGRADGRSSPLVLLLPGSRPDEIRRHLPVLAGAIKLMRDQLPALRAKMVLPHDSLARDPAVSALPPGTEIQVGVLTEVLAQADLAITKSGTVTLECALCGVPAVVFYRTSWPTYLVAKKLVRVPYLAMPNLLAGEEIFPEYVQHAATPENLARAALELLRDEARRQAMNARLRQFVSSLGGPGATWRAADAVARLVV